MKMSGTTSMTIRDIVPVAIALAAGGIAGAVFFGGLWLTVKRIITARQPALLMIGSLIIRAAIVMVIFYVASAGEVMRLIACLVGFILMRVFMVRYLQPVSKAV
jgi:F1F0 ATPase subunit 2